MLYRDGSRRAEGPWHPPKILRTIHKVMYTMMYNVGLIYRSLNYRPSPKLHSSYVPGVIIVIQLYDIIYVYDQIYHKILTSKDSQKKKTPFSFIFSIWVHFFFNFYLPDRHINTSMVVQKIRPGIDSRVPPLGTALSMRTFLC